MQTNTNNINKTWALLQATGDKDEPFLCKQAFFYYLWFAKINYKIDYKW
jgi:hypothetical protein